LTHATKVAKCHPPDKPPGSPNCQGNEESR
jgi:hypothetical protein